MPEFVSEILRVLGEIAATSPTVQNENRCKGVCEFSRIIECHQNSTFKVVKLS